MSPSIRLFNCVRCHCQVMVCQACDRGQRYCANGCRESAKKASRKRAVRKYQNTGPGRFNNAARQKRFRQKKKQNKEIVTHQGSPSHPDNDLLNTKKITPKKEKRINRLLETDPVCHFCGACYPFIRLGFLRNRTKGTPGPKQPSSLEENIE